LASGCCFKMRRKGGLERRDLGVERAARARPELVMTPLSPGDQRRGLDLLGAESLLDLLGAALEVAPGPPLPRATVQVAPGMMGAAVQSVDSTKSLGFGPDSTTPLTVSAAVPSLATV
jgi:hypothetical protein